MCRSMIIALTFLTRIPIKINFTYDEKDLGRTSRYFPLVGLIIGLLVAGVAYVFGGIDRQLGAVAAILTGVILTGGLHLDGFMDTADGIFSARKRDKMLEIMKDSRVGAHGVT
ncbi:MAG: adenosylcobinamide-GDP ribazoletransferase, partial [Desulfitobacteriaceae bacterium]|nr:adenosylcobinamide-GDP ribazoletransferase [Desulfitobacteriaceae bacterium]